ncbi:uncharacterized protein LAESUDRAFT_230166 [Laetiporus sulphureus 93-53]|uniref:Uncharacterized protein n=1 Tax=Laetiporus sulphureus 93-53 TaxID=1314785 RepID=A0A165DQS5_9APHY|nr:uncharacterized protein LAESUDRAFT_230166 [Laetiporus sulphureus 93-53]KZT05424.1 hypothetical protein LAESUDRAFT_230166 [Laetiporus sulphureus 93-53]
MLWMFPGLQVCKDVRIALSALCPLLRHVVTRIICYSPKAALCGSGAAGNDADLPCTIIALVKGNMALENGEGILLKSMYVATGDATNSQAAFRKRSEVRSKLVSPRQTYKIV